MTKPLAPDPPPEAWPNAQRLVHLVAGPLARFLRVEAASGVVLLVAALVALCLANSSLGPGFEHLLAMPISFAVGAASFSRPLHFWINDGLMVVFFFVVGLEIRREIHAGELSVPKRAALPVAAALGGMLAPALIYIALNRTSGVPRGFGIPTATDIAFAVGVLALLGRRIPPAVRVLLLALAIIDDIGAILVIALFYSSALSLQGLLLAALGVLLIGALRALGVRRTLAYVPCGVVLWAGLLVAGIHPTIAGVILGLMTPAQPWYGEGGFLSAAARSLGQFEARIAGEHEPHDLLEPLAQISEAQREAVAPTVRLEAALHPWVAYGIMPLFALANAGVDLRGVRIVDVADQRVLAGVVLGLVIGKPVGVLLASALALRVGIAARPRGASTRGLVVVGIVAGIGFTMAIFIAGLAFPGEGSDRNHLAVAKLAVLVGSTVAGLLALAAGRLLLPRPESSEGGPLTVDAAEQSTAE